MKQKEEKETRAIQTKDDYQRKEGSELFFSKGSGDVVDSGF